MNEIDLTPADAPVYKRIDGPWIGLLVLSILILLFSIIAMIALFVFWRRSRQLTQMNNQNYILSNKPIGNRQIPVQVEDQPSKGYETQKVETYLPQPADERIHTQFASPDDIQRMQQFYERTSKAYF